MSKVYNGSTSTTGFKCLCDDLVADILSRLTTSDLHRCDLVCKTWRQIIIPSTLSRRPKLALIQHQMNHTPSLLCFPPSLNPHLTTNIHPKPSHLEAGVQHTEWFDLLLTCNGMTLSRCVNYYYYGVEIISPGDDRLVVQNPITGNLHWLDWPDSSFMKLLMLVFDPRTSIHEFKIITTEQMVYSSTTRDWALIKAGPVPRIEVIPPIEPSEISKGVYCLNGFAYKLINYSCNFMVKFNIEDERLELDLLPCSSFDERVALGFNFLGESAGHLVYGYFNRGCLWTWVYEGLRSGYHRTWVARYKVGIGVESAGSVPSPHPQGWTIFFHPGELDVVLLVVNGTLYLIGMSTTGLREVGKLPITRESSSSNPHLIFPFLLPPNVQPSSPVHILAD